MLDVTERSTFGSMSPMPEPGDRSPGFMADVDRWAMVYDRNLNLQSTHCREAPTYTGR